MYREAYGGDDISALNLRFKGKPEQRHFGRQFTIKKPAYAGFFLLDSLDSQLINEEPITKLQRVTLQILLLLADSIDSLG